MGQFSDALQGYDQGANNSLQIQEQNLNRPTPVQAFLQQLRTNQEQSIQQQQVQGLVGYRNALVGNQGDRNVAVAQHYQDLANFNNQRATTSDARLTAWQNIQNATLAVKQANQKVQAGVAGANTELIQAKIQQVNAETSLKQVYGPAEAQSIIDRNTAASTFTGTKNTNAQGPSFSDVSKQYNTDLKMWGRLPLNQRGPMPTLQDSANKLQAIAPGAAQKNAVTLADPSSSSALSPDPTATGVPDPSGLGTSGTLGTPPQMPMLPFMGGSPLPQDQPTQDALKKVPRDPLAQLLQPSAPPDPPPPNVASMNSMDPLHGQFSARTPGLYSMNGGQYLVDGSGMISAMGSPGSTPGSTFNA